MGSTLVISCEGLSTVCSFTHAILSQIYALLSIKFSGLKSASVKNMTNMRYAFLCPWTSLLPVKQRGKQPSLLSYVIEPVIYLNYTVHRIQHQQNEEEMLGPVMMFGLAEAPVPVAELVLVKVLRQQYQP